MREHQSPAPWKAAKASSSAQHLHVRNLIIELPFSRIICRVRVPGLVGRGLRPTAARGTPGAPATGGATVGDDCEDEVPASLEATKAGSIMNVDAGTSVQEPSSVPGGA